jgi:3-isopropylmalate dehydrogenase
MATGLDLLMVRELTGGIYFGQRGRSAGANGAEAFDTERYSELEIERIGRVGFESAMKRRKKITSVDKANVLESSRLWRETMHRLAKEYPDVHVRGYARGQRGHAVVCETPGTST